MENNLTEIREFINQWKERAINYYHKAIEEYQKQMDDIRNNCDVFSGEYANRKRQLISETPALVRDLASGYSAKDREERLQKAIEREAKAKEALLIGKVNKKVGKIIRAIDLCIGANGELNGHIEGERGICSVETIYAGGYNVQRLHYRVLVK